MSLGRGIASAVTTDIANEKHVRLVSFAKLELDSGTLYMHDSIGTFTWSDPDDGSKAWSAIGDFGGISTVEESKQISAYEITISLSGIDASFLDEVLNQSYQGRSITIYLGALDLDDNTLLATPSEVWEGVMDVSRIAFGSGEGNTIEVVCESEFARLDDINGRTFSDSDLQAEYPGDTFLQYLHVMKDATIVWRGESRHVFDTTPPPPFDPRNLPSFF